MGQVIFHKKLGEKEIYAFRHVTRDKDCSNLISQGWELVHIEHSSNDAWNHYMLAWIKDETPPEYKTVFEQEKEAKERQLERERHLVEVLVTLIPEGLKPDAKLKLSVEKHFRILKEESNHTYDSELYPYASDLIQSRFSLSKK